MQGCSSVNKFTIPLVGLKVSARKRICSKSFASVSTYLSYGSKESLELSSKVVNILSLRKIAHDGANKLSSFA